MSGIFSYKNKRIIITGAFSGIGKELVRILSDLGATDITALDIKEPKGPIHYIETDMGDPASVDSAISEIDGSVDLLFNNAGIAATRPAEEVMRVNFLGLRRLSEGLLPQIREGGSIINTASVAGNLWQSNLDKIMELFSIENWEDAVNWINTNADVVADGYFFSKQCVQCYTMYSSRPFIGRGVRINSVCPSPVDTPLLPDFRKTMTDAMIEWSINQGCGKIATAEDIASVLAFLGSNAASYINGVNLQVDGGFTATLTTGQGINR